MGAPAARAAELAQHWTRARHEVSILTGFPNHPTGVVPSEWRPRLRRLTYHERVAIHPPGPVDVRNPRLEAGFDVFRTWLWPLPNRKAHERMRNYASFCVSAAIRGLALPRPEVIIATSPQLLVALAGWWLAFVRRLPFVFEVRDLWPESLTAVGIGNEDSLLHRSLAKIAGFLYERADLIVVVTPAFREYLIRHWRIPAEKIAVAENGVETDIFSPQLESANRALRRELRADGKFLVCYVGTMGMAHGLETLLDAAANLLPHRPDVMFLLVGEGAEKARIKSLAESRRLTNVGFLDYQPRERIPAFISACDAGLVLLKKSDVFKTVIPTKMLEFMACARPVIVGVDGQARQIVEQAGAGIAIEPESPLSLAQAIIRLTDSGPLGSQLGRNGREYILKNLSREKTAQTYIQVLDRLLQRVANRD